jgi:O-glycosyl hydrolase
MFSKVKKSVCALLACAILLPLFSSSASAEIVAPRTANDVIVNLSAERQVIRGFGGMNHVPWIGDLTPAQRETAFGNGGNQLGFSILRIPIDEDKRNWQREVETAKKAIEHGAIVFASPWNPPSEMVETFTLQMDPTAKRLKHDMYDEYAQYLNEFDSFMKSNGVELYAISVQNEPDYAHDWTWWSPEEMLRFMKENAGSIHNRVIAPESFSYVKRMTDPILNDPEALAHLDILGAHTYGTRYSDFPYPLFEEKGEGKELWMTEVYYPNSDNNSADRWPEALGVAQHMYNAMVEGNFQTYVWWYIRRQYGPMKEDGTISKRGYSMAHYSKFIRPGYVRVEATKNSAPQLYTSAYKGDNKIVIVAVNQSDSAVNQKFVLQNGSAAKVSAWVTDSSRNLAAGAPLLVSNGAFSAELPAQSVTTFVAEGDSVPAAELIADRRVKPGSSFTMSANLTNLEQIVHASDLTLTYDSSIFEYVRASGADNRTQIITEDTANDGIARLIAVHLGGISGASTPLLNLSFKVRDDVQSATSIIATTQVKLGVAPEGTVIDAALGNYNITVDEEATIDLNNDGSIDIGDFAIVVYYFGKNSADSDWNMARIADMNNDNQIDIVDLAYVATRLQ